MIYEIELETFYKVDSKNITEDEIYFLANNCSNIFIHDMGLIFKNDICTDSVYIDWAEYPDIIDSHTLAKLEIEYIKNSKDITCYDWYQPETRMFLKVATL